MRADFNVGDTIEKAAEEAIRVARHLAALIVFDFNGVECVATPNGSAERLVAEYLECVNSEGRRKMAFA